jgi:hypothetical protein
MEEREQIGKVLTADDLAQIAEGIEHFIMNGDPEVDGIWQPYVEKLNAAAAAVPAEGDSLTSSEGTTNDLERFRALLERARMVAAEDPRLHLTKSGIQRPTNATRLRAFIGELADALEATLPVDGIRALQDEIGGR